MKITFTTILLSLVQILFAQNINFNSELDSVYMVSGVTLVGKVSIDKDNDRFILEARDTFSFQLLPSEVQAIYLQFARTKWRENNVYCFSE